MYAIQALYLIGRNYFLRVQKEFSLHTQMITLNMIWDSMDGFVNYSSLQLTLIPV